MIGRTIPNSPEAEAALLGSMFVDPREIIAKCREQRVSDASFFDAQNAAIMRVALALDDSSEPVTVSTVAEELKSAPEFSGSNIYTKLVEITDASSTTAQASYFIGKVREQALLREIIRTATGAVEDCYGFSGGIEQFVDEIEQKMFAVTQNRVSDRTMPASAIVPNAMAVITAMTAHKGEMTGVRSGFRDLDQLTWGFQKSDMIVLAARPSMGKTALALNIAETIVLPSQPRCEKKPVLFFSLEMSAQQLLMRMICSRAKVNLKLLRDGLISKNGEEQSRMIEAADQLGRSPLFIDDSSSLPVSHIRARARRVHARNPLGAIVVDYLQLMAPSDKGVPREQQVAEASRGLKALAKELNVPVIVLSQLNRASDKENRPPRLSDLRESGAIEQDADVVLMLSRPKEADDRFQVASDTVDLIVAKQRNGPVGDLKLTFLRDITRFESYCR